MESERNSNEKIKFQINKNKLPVYIFEMFKSVIFLFAIISILFTFFVKDVNIDGQSMKNTLFDGDKAILTSFLYTPEVGDIVAIDAEQQIGKTIIKRVIATEGQTIKIDYDKNRVIVDGIVIDDDYVASPTIMPTIGWDVPETVPEGYVFVMGDNRSVSLDSRSGSIQLIPKTMILGKAQFVIYPFEHFKYLYWFQAVRYNNL